MGQPHHLFECHYRIVRVAALRVACRGKKPKCLDICRIGLQGLPIKLLRQGAFAPRRDRLGLAEYLTDRGHRHPFERDWSTRGPAMLPWAALSNLVASRGGLGRANPDSMLGVVISPFGSFSQRLAIARYRGGLSFRQHAE